MEKPVREAADLPDVVVAAGGMPAAVPTVVPAVASEVAAPVTAVDSVVAAYAPHAAQRVDPAQVVVETAHAVADTLLVSPGLLRGQGEIRIQLKPEVLEGTEVRLAVTGRRLNVEFLPTTPELAVLLERCGPQLQAHLAEKVHAFQIAVDVKRRLRAEERE